MQLNSAILLTSHTWPTLCRSTHLNTFNTRMHMYVWLDLWNFMMSHQGNDEQGWKQGALQCLIDGQISSCAKYLTKNLSCFKVPRYFFNCLVIRDYSGYFWLSFATGPSKIFLPICIVSVSQENKYTGMKQFKLRSMAMCFYCQTQLGNSEDQSIR